MGDVAMLPHALRALMSAYPDLRVTVATRPMFKPFFEGLGVDFLDVDLKGVHHSLRGMWRLAAEARRLAEEAGLEIAFRCLPAEETDFPDGSFDVVTACQCFFYFDHALLAPRLSRILKRPGRLAALYMAWLPGEDPIAAKSEELVQRYNPGWTGGGETRHPIAVPDAYEADFEMERQEVFDLRVPFTREGWNGRMKACRGIGASLPAEEIARFDREHLALLERIAPPRFEILHYAAVTVLRTKETGASAPQ